MSKWFGLIGANVENSFSPALHALFSCPEYRLISLSPGELPGFLRRGDFAGVNVTIPYKEAILPYADELSPRAGRIGSANLLLRREDGSLYGDNTDYDGVCACLDGLSLPLKGQKVLILGSGGTSKTVRAVLEDRGACPQVISRRGGDCYGTLPAHRDAYGIINTTPVSEESLVDLRDFPKLAFVMDVIYRPLRSALLQQAQALGIPSMGGITMLVVQAAAAARLFYHREPEPQAVAAARRELLRRGSNILLIGMPGCGKSTLGRLLGERLHMPFVDTDLLAEQRLGMTIPQCFARLGEPAFRAAEAAAIREACAQGGRVIAAGGGAPLSAENRLHLRMNGLVIWLLRDPSKLPASGRPLSQGKDLSRMLARRTPAYRSCADIVISNNGSPEACLQSISEAYHAYLCCERP